MVLSIGVIYSLPNLYPAKPAIQIAYTDSGKSADQTLLNQVKDILEDQVRQTLSQLDLQILQLLILSLIKSLFSPMNQSH